VAPSFLHARLLARNQLLGSQVPVAIRIEVGEGRGIGLPSAARLAMC
jgi:hypothetical protein